MTSSLIISTYNWPEALKLVLFSVLNQKQLPDEIIIADDGSDYITKNLIDSFKENTSIKIVHVWQEDKGFRKSLILNKAIEAANSDYIIQIDGDLILHKYFVRDHLKHLEANTYLYGSRVTLKKDTTRRILEKEKIEIHFFSKGIKKRGRMIYLRLPSFCFKKENKNSKKVRGCNLSYWKSDALKINGYNEDFVGWGYEDFEFVQRLLNLGIEGKRLKNNAIQYHLYHKEAPKGDTSIGDNLLINTIQNKISYISKGINKSNKH